MRVLPSHIPCIYLDTIHAQSIVSIVCIDCFLFYVKDTVLYISFYFLRFSLNVAFEIYPYSCMVHFSRLPDYVPSDTDISTVEP